MRCLCLVFVSLFVSLSAILNGVVTATNVVVVGKSAHVYFIILLQIYKYHYYYPLRLGRLLNYIFAVTVFALHFQCNGINGNLHKTGLIGLKRVILQQ